MKAMVLTGHGDLDNLVWHEDWPVPEAGPGPGLGLLVRTLEKCKRCQASCKVLVFVVAPPD